MYTLNELQANNLTDGWAYLPICIDYIADPKKKFVKKGGAQDKLQARKEKMAKMKAARNSSSNQTHYLCVSSMFTPLLFARYKLYNLAQ